MLEILSPAGDIERLNAAITFGADAVYLAGKEFGMRAAATNFDDVALKQAVDFAHSKNVKVYVTCNTLPRNDEIDKLPSYLAYLSQIGVDACIASDIGVLSLIKQHIPTMNIHISTQAGIVNYQTANALYDMGASRIVLARELSLDEIAGIRAKTNSNLEIEAFVHGAMCMAFSGRCIISNYLINRDANRGECAQPCRWGYHLVEEKRPNEYYPIFEDEKGTYILNAKDMCMIEYIDKLAKAGITSFKIEGRAKSSYYVAVVTNAYKMALEHYIANSNTYTCPKWLVEEVHKVSHRQYSTGFYFDTPTQYYENGGYTRNYDVIAVVDGYNDGNLLLTQKNKFTVGDSVEILEPNSKPIEFLVKTLYDENMVSLDNACHASMKLIMPYNKELIKGSIIRKCTDKQS